MSVQKQVKGKALPAEHREVLRLECVELGEHRLADLVGISRNALARAMGGLPLYPATRTAVRAHLERTPAA